MNATYTRLAEARLASTNATVQRMKSEIVFTQMGNGLAKAKADLAAAKARVDISECKNDKERAARIAEATSTETAFVALAEDARNDTEIVFLETKIEEVKAEGILRLAEIEARAMEAAHRPVNARLRFAR